jgi:hypothetical protein
MNHGAMNHGATNHEPPTALARLDEEISARFPEYAALVTENLQADRDRCTVLARRHRRWFRLTGFLTIVFSVSLPALTAAHFSGRDTAISVLAVAIAGLSGLRAFYQWDQSWQLYRSRQVALLALQTRWQLDMIRILRSAPPDADDQAHALTQEILQDAHDSGRSELNDFFSAIAWPQRGT